MRAPRPLRRVRAWFRRSRVSRRWERRGLQLRAWRKRGELTAVTDRTSAMPQGPIAITVLRNEAVRLPFFLDYYRRLGIVHFLMVDNGSTDGSAELLTAQPDVSLWRARGSYKASQFGVDWVNWLLGSHAKGRWILCVDPDEFLVYPHCGTRRLPALIRWLEQTGRRSFGTLLIDLYGKGPLSATRYQTGENPMDIAPWFDAHNYLVERHNRYHNLWIQGGPRMRVYAAQDPAAAPALNKTPLVKWAAGTVFVTSTHNLLPQALNHTYARDGGAMTSGALMHSKFLDTLPDKVAEELERREHYSGGREYESYAQAGEEAVLWTPSSTRYEGWRQLEDLGLIARGGWF
ncbi:MAG: glycosyltransferase family 2 protein [Pseudomonadota bacterium]